jgi:hypothetical protein
MHLPKTSKNLQIDKENSRALLWVAVATVIVVFCAFSVRALLAQGAYQRRVVNAKNDTVKQLQDNITAAESLAQQYSVFESQNPNVIGGKSDVPDNATPPDGKNSRIVLDALPTQYDFPALISSLSKLLGMHGIASPSVGGTDQGSAALSQPSANPQPQIIDQIPISGTANYGGIQNLIRDLERSIRPYDITSLSISGNEGEMTVSLVTSTYYQSASAVVLEKKEVK